MEIKETKPVSENVAKDLLQKRQKDPDFDYEQLHALEHVEKSHNSDSNKDKLIKELMKEFNLSEETAIKVVDLKPTKIETLKVILMKDKIELEDAALESILKKI